METNRITGIIVDAAYHIHEEAGPGLLESVYERILLDILTRKGLAVQRQVVIPVQFAGIVYDDAFRADLIVENCVIIEIKSVDRLAPVHKKQVLTYLKLSGIKVALLINFGGEYLKGNIERLSMPGAPPLPNSSP
ncbi:MAG TPA: GxxExxY protein [Candidatus Methylacidiphilales bacterium]|jgi:GxxExxY protein|nr:GxxExxY protein [Candidatus Methylacidiphilales bacterium]